jgi:hypothetical protein
VKDVDIIVDEFKYLQSIKFNIGSDEMSLLVRDLIEAFPK